MGRLSELTEKTLIPLGVAISAIGGGAVWLTMLWVQTNTNAQTIEKVEINQDRFFSSMSQVQKDVEVIKFKVDDLHRKLMERR